MSEDLTISQERLGGLKMIEKILRVIDSKRIVLDTESLFDEVSNATGVSHVPKIKIEVRSQMEIQEILKVARSENVALYPVSRGRNWGYGSRSPYRDGSILLDLSQMNSIYDFNDKTGVVTIGPGVTPEQLCQFLEKRGGKYLVPTTGAGPDGSILANALERGFGITPETDHFQAVMSLEVVLADGSIYRSDFAEKGATELDSHFKWSIGPYADGLFSQSGLGIVTKMSIALTRKQGHIAGLYFSLRRDQDFERACEIVQDIMHRFHGQVSGMNLMNALRVIAMSRQSPEPGSLTDRKIGELSRALGLSEWTGIGSLYADKACARAIENEIRRALKPVCSAVVFMTRERMRLLRSLTRFVPKRWLGRYHAQFDKIDESLEIFHGVPSRAALPLVYWKSKRPVPLGPIDVDRGDTGLLWYAPIVVMESGKARELERLIVRVCRNYDLDPLITFTAFNPRVFDVTVPLLFDRTDPRQSVRAHACYSELVAEGKKIGALPYRLGVAGAETMIESNSFWNFQKRLKSAFDPDDLLAPGRYSAR